MSKAVVQKTFDPALMREAIGQSVVKLDPRQLWRNPEIAASGGHQRCRAAIFTEHLVQHIENTASGKVLGTEPVVSVPGRGGVLHDSHKRHLYGILMPPGRIPHGGLMRTGTRP